MNSIAGWVGAIAIVVGMAGYPQKSMAEGFTGKEFLTWDHVGQDSYISTAVVMATFIATRTNEATAKCLNDWYAKSATISANRNDEIRSIITKNASHHPSAVIVLVLEGACGSFSDD